MAFALAPHTLIGDNEWDAAANMALKPQGLPAWHARKP
jgi:hypothetical protein